MKNLVFLYLACLTQMASAENCLNVSGQYIHIFEDSDFRRDYCVKVAQSDCHTLTFSDWSVAYKNGEVHKTDMTKYSPNTLVVDDPIKYLSFFRHANNEECK